MNFRKYKRKTRFSNEKDFPRLAEFLKLFPSKSGRNVLYSSALDTIRWTRYFIVNPTKMLLIILLGFSSVFVLNRRLNVQRIRDRTQISKPHAYLQPLPLWTFGEVLPSANIDSRVSTRFQDFSLKTNMHEHSGTYLKSKLQQLNPSLGRIETSHFFLFSQHQKS